MMIKNTANTSSSRAGCYIHCLSSFPPFPSLILLLLSFLRSCSIVAATVAAVFIAIIMVMVTIAITITITTTFIIPTTTRRRTISLLILISSLGAMTNMKETSIINRSSFSSSFYFPTYAFAPSTSSIYCNAFVQVNVQRNTGTRTRTRTRNWIQNTARRKLRGGATSSGNNNSLSSSSSSSSSSLLSFSSYHNHNYKYKYHGQDGGYNTLMYRRQRLGQGLIELQFQNRSSNGITNRNRDRNSKGNGIIVGGRISAATTTGAEKNYSNTICCAVKKKQQRERNWTSSTTSITGKWKEFFTLLQTFKSKHGHTRVPYNYTPNPQLGRWVARQRMLYRNLQQQQQEEGDGDGYEGLIPSTKKQQQQQTSTPTSASTSTSTSTSSTQNPLLRPATALTPERIAALQSIDFSFESPRTHTWTKRYDELCIYKSIHGDCLVPIKYDPFPGLGVWVRNQRTLYRNLQQAKANTTKGDDDDVDDGGGDGKVKVKARAASSYLSKEKISALQSIGFVWDTQRNDLWKKRFDELMDFRAVYGHCLVPEHYHENPQLGIWVVNQRTSYKNFLTGITGGNGNNIDTNSNTNDSPGNEKKPSSKSKILWKRNGGKSLTREKIIALESIGFCWAQTTYNWYSMFGRLKQYKEEKKQRYIMELQEQQNQQNNVDADTAGGGSGDNDHEDINLPEFFQVPPEDVANRDLRLWIAVQRKEYSNYLRSRTPITNIDENDNGKSNNNNNNPNCHNTTIKSAMTPRRIKALESIGFPWNVSKNFRSSKNTSGNDAGPSVDDWTKLFEQMREKGIDSNMRPKEHWFEGQSLLNDDSTIDNDFVKKDLNKEWTDDDLLALWNMEGDEDF